MRIKTALSLFLVVALTGCATQATHPSLREAPGSTGALPPLVPVRHYVADWDGTGAYQLSPDGQQLMWMARKGLGPGIYVQHLASGAVHSLNILGNPLWAEDSRHVLVMADRAGDENAHIYRVDSQDPQAPAQDLTPFPGSTSGIQTVVRDSGDLLIINNRREPKLFDLYRYSQATGELSLLAQNPGDVASWLTTSRGELLGRVRRQAERWLFEKRQAGEPEVWQTLFSVDPYDTVRPLAMAADGRSVWALSNRGRDKLALVKIALSDGQEELVMADARVDLNQVVLDADSEQPLLALSLEPDYQHIEAHDPRLRMALERLQARWPGRMRIAITSISRDKSKLTATLVGEDGGRHVLYNLGTDEISVLSEDGRSRRQATAPLPLQKAITTTSRDGLALHGYLTLPPGVAARALPTVLLVHGGPWGRDVWQSGDPLPEFLANRGYAVLQLNYRGSSGYGRQFQDAAVGEFAARMQDDLLDGLDHLVRQGITDPAKVAIMGASYGGYAALVGMSFTPERFACGISMVGMSDLASLLESAPPTWEFAMPWWKRFVGDPALPADRATMDRKSPLYRASAVSQPLLILHGANDPRVKLSQSTRMVEALRQAGKPVDFVLFQHAGHGTQRWSDNLRYYRKTEDFLAQCLGGRSGGLDMFELGSWAF